MMVATVNRSFFQQLDANDDLAACRDQFELADGLVCLNGNSLGPPPRRTWDRLDQVVHGEWRDHLNSAWWQDHWLDLPRTIGDRIGRLIGAAAGQVIVGESTSVNLFKLLCGALRDRIGSGRSVILTDTGNFPSDLYIADGIVDHIHPDATVRRVDPDLILDAIDDRVAVVVLSHVDYRTARILPMAEINRCAHNSGALVLWDLSHSAGVVPVDLDGTGTDLAVGCGYKYLHGGPGAPGYMYVAQRLLPGFRQPITGWLGHAAPFDFEPEYRPASGIGRLLTGCPPLLSLVALDEGVSVTASADRDRVRAKSMTLTQAFIDLLAGHDLTVVAPAAPTERGSHVSLRHHAARALAAGLGEGGFAVEFRAPDLIRMGFGPLFVRYVDVWDCVAALDQLVTAASRPPVRPPATPARPSR
jgi:kynureninase